MNNPYEALVFLFQIAMLWVFFAFLVKDYARDRLRQNLFAIRDSLFDEALAQGGGFQATPYTQLRGYVNQVIRRGHMFTPSRCIMLSAATRFSWFTGGITSEEINAQGSEEIAWFEETEKSNARVKEFRRAVHTELLKYYALTSPIFIAVMTVAIVAVICATGFMGLRKASQQAFDKFFARDIDRGISLDDCGAMQLA